MSESYSQAVATHYESYRPPLHEAILGKIFTGEEAFDQGLDVGCGTGYSAAALTKYCRHVYAIDPSQSMLERATPREKITYRQGTGEDIPLPDKAVDVITFAGSLFYAKSALLIKEMKRVCRSGAIVVPYDFEVLLDDVLLRCGINLEKARSDYDHEVNFSDIADFAEVIVGAEQVSLEVTASELAHVLLSSTQRFEAFVEKYNVTDPFPPLVSELECTVKQWSVCVNTYFSKYRLKGG